MEKVVTGCYICKHSTWDSEGCFCKLNGAHPLAPSIGCDSQEVEQKPDINSSYPERLIKVPNQLDSLTERVDNSFKNYGVVLINLEQRVDELSEEYDAVLKTHGDTLEQHMERITINEGNIDSISADVEDLQRKVYQIYRFLNSVDPDFFAKIQDEMMHKGSNFCGNCTHANKCRAEDGIYACELSGEIVDPDSASCSLFELPF